LGGLSTQPQQAEAERERRAKIIHATGELQAAGKLRQAADEMARSEGTMQLRYLETLNTISAEKNSTIIFPFCIDMLRVEKPIFVYLHVQ